jgi:cysteine desulfurase
LLKRTSRRPDFLKMGPKPTLMRSVYLDYNATTPLDSQVREAMMPFLGEVYGNPSSVHHVGRQARAILDEAHDRAARVLGCKPSEVVFTSGGTESNNLAIFGTARRFKQKGRHIITSAIEHHAVLHCYEYLARKEDFDVTYLPVNQEGMVSAEALAAAIRPDTILVSVMAANNEIGTIQPVGELGALCKQRGVVFHTDAVQWFGKEPFRDIGQFNADLVSICAHKLHGPKGSGALFVKSPLQPDPILFGGGHENERRAGTENLAAIIGMVEVLERFVRTPIFDTATLAPLAECLLNVIDQVGDAQLAGSRKHRLANTVSFVTRGADSIALLAGLDMEGICASSGSACSAGSVEPSHVIRALGIEPQLANSLVRFSFGRESSLQDASHVANVLPEIIERAKRCASVQKQALASEVRP